MIPATITKTTTPITIIAHKGNPPSATGVESGGGASDVAEIAGVVVEGGAGVGLSRRSRNDKDG